MGILYRATAQWNGKITGTETYFATGALSMLPEGAVVLFALSLRSHTDDDLDLDGFTGGTLRMEGNMRYYLTDPVLVQRSTVGSGANKHYLCTYEAQVRKEERNPPYPTERQIKLYLSFWNASGIAGTYTLIAQAYTGVYAPKPYNTDIAYAVVDSELAINERGTSHTFMPMNIPANAAAVHFFTTTLDYALMEPNTPTAVTSGDPGTRQYYYCLVARDANGKRSLPGGVVWLKVPDGSYTVSLTWDASDGAASYDVLRALWDGETFSEWVLIGNTSQLSFEDHGGEGSAYDMPTHNDTEDSTLAWKKAPANTATRADSRTRLQNGPFVLGVDEMIGASGFDHTRGATTNKAAVSMVHTVVLWPEFYQGEPSKCPNSRIKFVGSSGTHRSAVRTDTIDVPIPEASEGDVLLAFVACETGHAELVAPPGWKQIGADAYGYGHYLTDPPPPYAYTVGKQGTRTLTYYVVAIDHNGKRTMPSPAYTITDAPDTLDEGNYVVVTWRPLPGAVGYDVLRGTTSECIAQIRYSSPSGYSNWIRDTGLQATAYTPPVINESTPYVYQYYWQDYTYSWHYWWYNGYQNHYWWYAPLPVQCFWKVVGPGETGGGTARFQVTTKSVNTMWHWQRYGYPRWEAAILAYSGVDTNNPISACGRTIGYYYSGVSDDGVSTVSGATTGSVALHALVANRWSFHDLTMKEKEEKGEFVTRYYTPTPSWALNPDGTINWDAIQQNETTKACYNSPDMVIVETQTGMATASTVKAGSYLHYVANAFVLQPEVVAQTEIAQLSDGSVVSARRMTSGALYIDKYDHTDQVPANRTVYVDNTPVTVAATTQLETDGVTSVSLKCRKSGIFDLFYCKNGQILWRISYDGFNFSEPSAVTGAETITRYPTGDGWVRVPTWRNDLKAYDFDYVRYPVMTQHRGWKTVTHYVDDKDGCVYLIGSYTYDIENHWASMRQDFHSDYWSDYYTYWGYSYWWYWWWYEWYQQHDYNEARDTSRFSLDTRVYIMVGTPGINGWQFTTPKMFPWGLSNSAYHMHLDRRKDGMFILGPFGAYRTPSLLQNWYEWGYPAVGTAFTYSIGTDGTWGANGAPTGWMDTTYTWWDYPWYYRAFGTYVLHDKDVFTVKIFPYGGGRFAIGSVPVLLATQDADISAILRRDGSYAVGYTQRWDIGDPSKSAIKKIRLVQTNQ